MLSDKRNDKNFLDNIAIGTFITCQFLSSIPKSFDAASISSLLTEIYEFSRFIVNYFFRLHHCWQRILALWPRILLFKSMAAASCSLEVVNAIGAVLFTHLSFTVDDHQILSNLCASIRILGTSFVKLIALSTLSDWKNNGIDEFHHGNLIDHTPR